MSRNLASTIARWPALVATAALLAGPVAAQESRIGVPEAGALPYLFLGAGYDDFNDKSSPAAGFLVEAAWKSVFDWTPGWDTLLRLRPRAAIEFSSDGDVFAGAGLSLAVFPLGGPFFMEGSFLPGTYYRADADYFPIQFRSQIGAGWQFGNGHQIALTISHKSNKEWGPEDSSVETVLLRYGFPF